MHQVGELQPEPGCQRAWVRSAKRHPFPVGQPSALAYYRTEVCQVSQCLPAAEETQVVCAQVSKRKCQYYKREWGP